MKRRSFFGSIASILGVSAVVNSRNRTRDSGALDTTSFQNEKYRSFKAVGMPAGVYDSYEVWRWPEFKAFAKRLGIPLDLPTTDLAIILPLDESVRVIHTHQCPNA